MVEAVAVTKNKTAAAKTFPGIFGGFLLTATDIKNIMFRLRTAMSVSVIAELLNICSRTS